jgi:hypothetical protein
MIRATLLFLAFPISGLIQAGFTYNTHISAQVDSASEECGVYSALIQGEFIDRCKSLDQLAGPERPIVLTEELQDLCRQFEAIRADASSLLGDLTDAEFNWQPGSNQWSVGQCIDHLVVTGNSSLSWIRVAVDDARSRGLVSQGPFRYGMVEKWFVRQMEPPVKLKFKAPRAYKPTLAHDYAQSDWAQTVAAFYKLQDDFLRGAADADGLDLARIKVNNAVTRWFRLSLGQELAFNAAHERRHLWQARRVKQAPGFPRSIGLKAEERPP